MENVTESCLALLKAMLLECKYAINRDAGYVNLFLPTKISEDRKMTRIASVMIPLDLFEAVLMRLGLQLEEDHLERIFKS